MAGCTPARKTEAPSAAQVPPSPAASAVSAAPAAAAPSLGPAANALLKTVEAVQENVEGEQWLRDPGELEDAPPSVVAVMAALRKWSASGEGIAIGKPDKSVGRVMHLIRFGRAASNGLAASDDGLVIDLLRVARALRAPGNFVTVQLTGFLLASELYSTRWPAHTAGERAASTSEELRALAPTEGEVLACAREMVLSATRLAREVTWESVAREAAQDASSAPGGAGPDEDMLRTVAQVERFRRDAKLPLGEGWLRADYDDYATFWDETEELIEAAPDVQSVASLATERLAAAEKHPTSMLVRLLGPMVLSDRIAKISQDLERQVASLRADLAR